MASAAFTTANGGDPVRSYELFAESVKPLAGDLAKAGQYLVIKRVKETKAGLDIDGNLFAPYSPMYAFRKGSSQVSLYSASAGPHMLDAIAHREPSDHEMDMGIFGDTRLAMLAKAHNEGEIVRAPNRSYQPGRKGKRGKAFSRVFTIPARPFLGASEQDLKKMNEIITASVEERVKKISI